MSPVPNAFEYATEAFSLVFPGLESFVKDKNLMGMVHPPTLFVAYEDGRREMEVLGGMSKDELAKMHRAVAGEPDVRLAALVMEGWVTRLDLKDERQRRISEALKRHDISVSDLPDRDEALVVMVRVKEALFVSTCRIDRASHSLVRGELVDMSGFRSGGRFVDGNSAPFSGRKPS